MQRTPVLSASALAALVLLAGRAEAQPVITIDGRCPDHLVFQWEGALPNTHAGLVVASDTLGYQMGPGGRCGGTYLDIGPHGLRLAAIIRTGPEGRGVVSGRVSPSVCGMYLQMVVDDHNQYPCPTSNVVQIPQ
ncbi:MAG: hypothetical protein KJZ69_00455 [Phycisphaerales bacterium]|nr:hypothetical protein [Phycisphaerales bacterium]